MDKESPYCKKCGGCGYIGCCGIRKFLKEHVENKTNCPNEHSFIQEIVEYIEEDETFKLNFPTGDDTKMKNNYTQITYERNKKGEMIKTREKNIGTKSKKKKQK